jgi:ribosome biogenesis protein Nip4
MKANYMKHKNWAKKNKNLERTYRRSLKFDNIKEVVEDIKNNTRAFIPSLAFWENPEHVGKRSGMRESLKRELMTWNQLIERNPQLKEISLT